MFKPDTVYSLRNIGPSLITEIFRWVYTHRDWKTSQDDCSPGRDCQNKAEKPPTRPRYSPLL